MTNSMYNYKRLVTQVANVFATYKVDPHDEGAPVQDVVDHLTRCIAHLLPQDEQAWFVTASRLQEPLWRFDHEAHAVRMNNGQRIHEATGRTPVQGA